MEGADFGVGLEGGVAEIAGRWMECGWIAICKSGSEKIGLGTSARFELSPGIVRSLQAGKELQTDPGQTGCGAPAVAATRPAPRSVSLPGDGACVAGEHRWQMESGPDGLLPHDSQVARR